MGNVEKSPLDDSRAIYQLTKYYNIKSDINLESSEDIIGVLDKLLEPNGIMRRGIELTGDWYRHGYGPILARHKDSGELVALFPHGLGGYFFYNQYNVKKRVNASIAKMFDANALTFYRTFPLREMTIRDLIRYSLSTITVNDVILFLLAMASGTLVGMFIPKIVNVLFKYVTMLNSLELLVGTGIGLVAVVICKTMLDAWKNLIATRITERMDNELEAASMLRILSLPVGFYRDYDPGNMMNRLAYIQILCGTFVNSILVAGFGAAMSLVYVFQLVKYAPSLVWPAILILILTLIVSIVTVIYDTRRKRKQYDYSAKLSGFSFSMINGVPKVRLTGAEHRIYSRWEELYRLEAKLEYFPPLIVRYSGTITLGISLLGTLLIYYQAIRSGVAVADYYSFNTAYGFVVAAFAQITGMIGTLGSVRPGMEMVEPILKAVPEHNANRTRVEDIDGSVELNNVKFRYEEETPYILEDFSLKINPGEYVAIVGQTGCGKSTIMRLMLGFETPEQGDVSYGDYNLSDVDIRSLRSKIGVVQQDGMLFPGDILNNIIVSAPMATEEDAWRAAEIAGVAEDIRQMPMGLHTLIAEGSSGISGGQKQRILIARAVVNSPKILMLDEATSALDNISQRVVTQSLDSLDCTRIVIAHRLSTIKNCKRIIMIDQGKIIEEGTYDELISQDGAFAELVRQQRLDSD